MARAVTLGPLPWPACLPARLNRAKTTSTPRILPPSASGVSGWSRNVSSSAPSGGSETTGVGLTQLGKPVTELGGDGRRQTADLGIGGGRRRVELHADQ